MKIWLPRVVFICIPAAFLQPIAVHGDSSLPLCTCSESDRRLLSEADARRELVFSDEECFCLEEDRESTEQDCCYPGFFGSIIYFFKRLFQLLCFFCDDGEANRRGRVLQEGGSAFSQVENTQVRPEGSPNYDGSVLLADDVGLWKLPNFLDDDGVKTMLETINESTDLFWDCFEHHCAFRPGLKACLADPTKRSGVQPPGKQCLLVTEPVKERLPNEKKQLWQDLATRFQNLWPEYIYTSPFFVQIQEGQMEHFKFHVDGDYLNRQQNVLSPVSTVLYLTDGGSKLIFPRANGTGVEVTPKAGMAITWYNIDQEKQPFQLSVHGVEESPEGSSARISVANKYTHAPALHDQYNAVNFDERASVIDSKSA